METESSDLESSASTNGPVGTVVSLSHLPWEIMEEIFLNLDAKSLVICKRVCEEWRKLVHYLEQKKNFWYISCQKEILPGVQFDLLDNIYPSHWKDQNKVDWEEIYKCWYTWEHLYETPVTITKVVSGLDGISSIKVAGKWIIMSTCQGRGKLLAQRFDEFGGLIEVYVGGGAILNIELVMSDARPISNMVSKSSVLETIFISLGYNEIWLELKNCYIQLGRTYCRALDKVQQKVRHSYGYEMRLVCEQNCSSVILKKKCSKIRGPEFMEVELSTPYMRITDFWMNKIAFDSISHGKQLIIDAVSVNWASQEAEMTGGLGFAMGNEISEIYSWHSSLFVVYTNKRRVIISYNGEVREQMTPIKKGLVSSVLFYANYFFLGTDRGRLMIYKVTGPEGCLAIEVYQTPCWDLTVCDGTIQHLAIAETVHCDSKYPVVVCATPTDVYLVALNA